MSQVRINVSEYFYSIQGEGSTMGTPAVFIRLGGCNLMCGGKGTELDKELHNGAEWRCDTIEVWRKSKSYTIPELFKVLETNLHLNDLLHAGAHLIFTGGEPLLQQQAIIDFIRYAMPEMGFGRVLPKIEIETNGTILPSPLLVECVHVFNVSPKLINSGEVVTKRINQSCIDFYSALYSTRWKFVISQTKDFLEVNAMINLNTQRHKTWIMPAASNREQLAEMIPIVAALAVKHRVRFSTRLQIHIWNEVVGV